jgi:hypothetical protein
MTITSGHVPQTGMEAPGEVPGTAQLPERLRAAAANAPHILHTNGHGGYGADLHGFPWVFGGRRGDIVGPTGEP